MTNHEARDSVQKTLDSAFHRDAFAELAKDIVEYDSSKRIAVVSGNYIEDKFRSYIQSYERLGTYKDPEGEKLDVLIVRLKKTTSLERARTSQRNFIASFLKKRDRKEAALVAFVSPGGKDWRFSFIKMNYEISGGKVNEKLTSARRYSFLVGANEKKSHTAQSRLLPLVENGAPTLADIEEAFNIETVTEEFFAEYRNLLHNLIDALDSIIKTNREVREDFAMKGIEVPDFAQKLLGQIIFLYFLQKKGWFGVTKGKQWGDGSKDYLRELFNGDHGSYDNFFDEILEPLFYEALRCQREDDYYSRFKCRIPFLNGGLFDPLNNYDWINKDINLPNELFSNRGEQDDGGDGILDIFDRYNFTVKEDEPLEREVAIDPEMLGKIFERSLRVEKRKVTGTYYTPREIVHYMCQESLVHHLTTVLEDAVSQEDIITLIRYGDTYIEHDSRVASKKGKARDPYRMPLSVRQHAKEIDNNLATIRVCDPAVGSGAFPVGMMNEIIRVRAALTPYLDNADNRTAYSFKQHAIQECLYGVDISPNAAEICKLRLWLSLLVDENDRQTIRPLPNLDYKIVQGNALQQVAIDLLNDDNFKALEQRKADYFGETDIAKKQRFKEEIDHLIDQITNGHKEFDFTVYFSEVLHGKNSGFDVVIANPPYVEHKKLKDISPLLKRFSVYSGTADLYVYFYEIALNILRQAGVISFISSNKFIRTRYGSQLRALLSKKQIHNIIDFTEVKVFDALVASCIILASKKSLPPDISVTFADDTFNSNLADYIANNHIKVSVNSLGNEIWQLGAQAKLDVKGLIEKNTKKLGKASGVEIFRGVTTGHNPAFIISKNKRKELIDQDSSNKGVIKHLLQGRNIRRWFYENANEHLLFIPWHFPLHQEQNISGASVEAERAFKNNYPGIYSHVSQFKDDLIHRNEAETGIRYEWYALQRCAASYYPEFEKEKVVWGLTADKWAFAYDDKGHYLPSNGYILTSSSLAIKYILALLNSRLMRFYFGFVGVMTAGGAYTLKRETIANFPIHELPQSGQKPFIDLVDKILAITKTKGYSTDNAKKAKVQGYEQEIDRLVYALYGLEEADIEVMEGKTPSASLEKGE